MTQLAPPKIDQSQEQQYDSESFEAPTIDESQEQQYDAASFEPPLEIFHETPKIDESEDGEDSSLSESESNLGDTEIEGEGELEAAANNNDDDMIHFIFTDEFDKEIELFKFSMDHRTIEYNISVFVDYGRQFMRWIKTTKKKLFVPPNIDSLHISFIKARVRSLYEQYCAH